MRYFMMAAGFQDVEKPDNIGIDIGAGMVDAVTDAGLCRQIHDDIRMK